MSGDHRPDKGGTPAIELIDQLARERAAAQVMAERYPHAGHPMPGTITDRARLDSALGRVMVRPERGVEHADAAMILGHVGIRLQGRNV